MMNILLITEELPYPPNSGCKNGLYLPIKCAQILPDINIHVISLYSRAEEKYIHEFNTTISKSQLIEDNNLRNSFFYKLTKYIFNRSIFFTKSEKEFMETIRKNIRENKYDVIILAVNETSSLIEFYNDLPYRRILFPRDSIILKGQRFINASNSLLSRMVGYLYLNRYKLFERKILNLNFDVVLYVSEDDASVAKNFVKNRYTRVLSIPLGVDKNYFYPTPKDTIDDNITLLFTGVMNTKPNEDAALYLIDLFSKLKSICHFNKIKLIIGGKNPTQKILQYSSKIKDIVVTGYVDDIRTLYWNADIYVSPLRFGSGMKNKILEAMSCGLPILASTESVSGLKDLKSSIVLTYTSEQESLEKLQLLIRERELRYQLGQNARHYVEENYSWEKVAEKFKCLISNFGV